jgi:hypothetical protein
MSDRRCKLPAGDLDRDATAIPASTMDSAEQVRLVRQATPQETEATPSACAQMAYQVGPRMTSNSRRQGD